MIFLFYFVFMKEIPVKVTNNFFSPLLIPLVSYDWLYTSYLFVGKNEINWCKVFIPTYGEKLWIDLRVSRHFQVKRTALSVVVLVGIALLYKILWLYLRKYCWVESTDLMNHRIENLTACEWPSHRNIYVWILKYRYKAIFL